MNPRLQFDLAITGSLTFMIAAIISALTSIGNPFMNIFVQISLTGMIIGLMLSVAIYAVYHDHEDMKSK